MSTLGVSEGKLLSVNTKESFIILIFLKIISLSSNIILEVTNITESAQGSRNFFKGCVVFLSSGYPLSINTDMLKCNR